MTSLGVSSFVVIAKTYAQVQSGYDSDRHAASRRYNADSRRRTDMRRRTDPYRHRVAVHGDPRSLSYSVVVLLAEVLSIYFPTDAALGS